MNARAVWAELTDEERRVVTGMCRTLSLPGEAWPAVPALRVLLVTVAIERRRGKNERSGRTERAALRAAALAIEGADQAWRAHLKRLREWLHQAVDTKGAGAFATLGGETPTRRTDGHTRTAPGDA